MKKIHRVTQGDTWTIKCPLYVDGVLTPIDGWKFWMTVKRSAADADADAVCQKSTDGGEITAHDAQNFVIQGDPADTKGKDAGRCEYDIQGRDPEGGIHTLEDGYFFIDPEKTRAA